jgi:hypothetical protein
MTGIMFIEALFVATTEPAASAKIRRVLANTAKVMKIFGKPFNPMKPIKASPYGCGSRRY